MTLRSAFILGLALNTALVAQAPTPSADLVAQDRPGIIAGSIHELTLDDMIMMVVQDSPDVEASRLDIKTADYNLLAAQGAYDPTFTNDTRYQKKATPSSSVLGGAEDGRLNETNLSETPGFSGLIPWGGNWSVSGYSQKLTSSSLFVPLNPQYVTGIIFSFTEPLWRNRSIDAPRRAIRVASRNREVSAAQFRSKVITVVAQAAKAYFDLLAAQENLDIQRSAYEQAERNLEGNKRMAAQGLLAQSDIASARTQVSQYETAWYGAQDQMAAVENAIKTMMLPSRTAPLWNAWLKPVSTINTSDQRMLNAALPVEEAINVALQSRPEIAQMKSLAQISEINNQYFKNQTRPQVDVYSSYTGQGLAGVLASRQVEALPFPSSVPPGLIGSVSTGLESVLAANFPTFEAGMRISIPIRNRTAEANLALSEVDMRRVRNQTNQVEQSIVAEVRNAAQALKSARARVVAAGIGRESAQLEYDGEQRKLQVGLTSVFELFQEQVRLVEAEGRELQARTDLRKAVIEMERAMGKTLDVYHVDIDQATPLSPAKPAR